MTTADLFVVGLGTSLGKSELAVDSSELDRSIIGAPDGRIARAAFGFFGFFGNFVAIS